MNPQRPLPVRIGDLVSPKLIAMLRQAFPRKAYKPENTVGEIMHSEGQQSLIDYLESSVELASKKDQ